MANSNTLHCPFCHKRDMNIDAFVEHLNYAHNTTPSKIGLGFQCKCGFLGIHANSARLHKYSPFDGSFGCCCCTGRAGMRASGPSLL